MVTWVQQTSLSLTESQNAAVTSDIHGHIASIVLLHNGISRANSEHSIVNEHHFN